jgi:hypothetical protein
VEFRGSLNELRGRGVSVGEKRRERKKNGEKFLRRS